MKKNCNFTLQFNHYEKHEIYFFVFRDGFDLGHRDERLQKRLQQ